VIVRANDGVHTDDQALAITVTNVANESAPVITSKKGGATASVSVAENTTAVTTIRATDADGTTPTYAIAGGADAAKFAINTTSGALAFKVAPGFGAPSDAGGNNVYEVTVRATDGTNVDDGFSGWRDQSRRRGTSRFDFDSNGFIARILTENADGTHKVALFAPLHQVTPTEERLFSADWTTTLTRVVYDGQGHILQYTQGNIDEAFNADGLRIRTIFTTQTEPTR
jgi:hypothetical protein